MTTNDKHLEEKPHKTGDHQVAGTPITNAKDNALKQRQENLQAVKAYRFTKGDNPFTLDMENGEKVRDKRPLKQEPSLADQAVDGLRNLIPSRVEVKTGRRFHQEKDGTWVEDKDDKVKPHTEKHQKHPESHQDKDD